jgi:hypothetical protein
LLDMQSSMVRLQKHKTGNINVATHSVADGSMNIWQLALVQPQNLAKQY